MRKQDKIAELLELMKVPDVQKVIFLALDEAKGKMKEEINRYNKIENLLKKTRENIRKTLYRFELKKKDDNQWHIMNISPHSSDEVDIEAFISTYVFPHISLNTSSLGSREIFNEILFKDKHSFNVDFIKFDENHVFGIIHEIVNSINGDTLKEIDIECINDDNETMTIEEKYKEIFYYMEKDPNIRDILFDWFFLLLRPDTNIESLAVLK